MRLRLGPTRTDQWDTNWFQRNWVLATNSDFQIDIGIRKSEFVTKTQFLYGLVVQNWNFIKKVSSVHSISRIMEYGLQVQSRINEYDL